MRTDYEQYEGVPGVLSPPPDPRRDHMQGSPTAPVQLVEYGDFQCPFCARAHPVVKAVQQAMGDEMAFTFRHFPLVQVHPMAEPAAEAAEAAGAQGRFWPMHDQLFTHQPELSPRTLLVCATAAGIEDLDRFAAELADRRYAVRVLDDFESGVRSGVQGTPTFFVNGLRHEGAADAAGLLGAVQAAALRVPH
ncbi:MAG: oxidoreductase [Frankiales bacterium]|nr:oxidoreductase [Frankiales bacterium]